MNPREEWHLDTQHVGRRVLVYDRVESTNTHAAHLANQPGYDGVVVLASEQTAGRGQYGRSWQAPAGTSVLLSALLFPSPALRRPAVLTAWAAVAVCETIRRATGLQAKIKWPNDILIQGKKVCGILIEQRAGVQKENGLPARSVSEGASSLAPVVIGIGLNVNQSADFFSSNGLSQAASLALFTSSPLGCAETALQLIRQLDEAYCPLCQDDLTLLEACWKWRLGVLGKRIEAECADGVHAGRVLDVTFDGLLLEAPGSGTVRLSPERVRHLRVT